jgi:hypothetical protein
MQWDFDIIKSLIEDAELNGESEVELSSPREADLFRAAINNNRRLKNLGQNLTTRVQDRSVIITRRPEIRLKSA